jgi:HAD superfamily hydrolase (TIGR01490 family)
MKVAFFDLDRTLLDVNSGRLWVRSEVRLGFLTRRQAARAALHLTRYHLGFGRMEPIIREAVATLTDTPEAALAERTEAFYRREVAMRVRPGGRQALADHQARGERCLLLTTSSIYLARLVEADLGIDGSLCTRFVVGPDGRFTGSAHEPLCYAAGKVRQASAWAAEQGIDLADCAFYTDSYSDLPMLEAVGHPVVVHPDPRLLRVARRRGWPVVDWGLAPR